MPAPRQRAVELGGEGVGLGVDAVERHARGDGVGHQHRALDHEGPRGAPGGAVPEQPAEVLQPRVARGQALRRRPVRRSPP